MVDVGACKVVEESFYLCGFCEGVARASYDDAIGREKFFEDGVGVCFVGADFTGFRSAPEAGETAFAEAGEVFWEVDVVNFYFAAGLHPSEDCFYGKVGVSFARAGVDSA